MHAHTFPLLQQGTRLFVFSGRNDEALFAVCLSGGLQGEFYYGTKTSGWKILGTMSPLSSLHDMFVGPGMKVFLALPRERKDDFLRHVFDMPVLKLDVAHDTVTITTCPHRPGGTICLVQGGRHDELLKFLYQGTERRFSWCPNVTIHCDRPECTSRNATKTTTNTTTKTTTKTKKMSKISITDMVQRPKKQQQRQISKDTESLLAYYGMVVEHIHKVHADLRKGGSLLLVSFKFRVISQIYIHIHTCTHIHIHT